MYERNGTRTVLTATHCTRSMAETDWKCRHLGNSAMTFSVQLKSSDTASVSYMIRCKNDVNGYRDENLVISAMDSYGKHNTSFLQDYKKCKGSFFTAIIPT